MLAGKQAVDRVISPIFALLLSGKMKHNHGIIFNSGESWKETRTFALRALRDMGFGKKTSESLILEETRALIASIKKLADFNEGVINVEKIFNKASLNVVWNISAGERFDYDDPNMEKLYKFIDIFNCIGS